MRAAPLLPSAAAIPFGNGPASRVFRVRYEGPPRLLREYLCERYRYGRSPDWERTFYPARVRLNEAPVDADTRVAPGDVIAYLHLRGDEPPVAPPGPPLHADPWLLALTKGDDAPVNPSGVHYFTALAIQARETFANPELTPIHRLDLETSGPVLFATRNAHLPACHALFQRRALGKRYRALVHGRFPPDLLLIAGRIVPDPASRILTRLRLEPIAPDEAAEAAALADAAPLDTPRPMHSRNAPAQVSLTRIVSVTHHDLGPRGVFSELELQPVTGKTNQLRVHLAHVGHPIVGDKKYHPDEAVFLDWHAHRDFARLADRLLLPRQALHCEALDFPHPFTGEPVEIHAPAAMWAAKVAGLLG